MGSSLVRAFSSTLVIAAMAACGGDAMSPELQLQGLYILKTVDAQQLPVPLWTENGQTLWLLSETLGFDGRGGVARTFSWRRDSLDVIGVEAQTPSLPFQYRVRGNGVALGSFAPCPPNALCIAPDVGVFRHDSLSLESKFFSGRRLSYLRGAEL